MFKKIIYATSLVSLSYADSLVYMNPSLIHTLSNKNHLEVGLTNRYNPSFEFEGSVKIPAVAQKVNVQAGSQKTVNVMPQLYYVAPKFGDFRFGFSYTPYIPSTRKTQWHDATISTFTKDYDVSYNFFTPTIAYKISDTTAVAAGLNIVKGKALQRLVHPNGLYNAELRGSGFGYGYSLSASTMLRENVILSLNSTSKTNVELKGNSAVKYNGQDVSCSSSVDTALPSEISATLIVFFDKDTSVFGSYKKRFWSQYKELDLDFEDKTAEAVLGKTTMKNWRDSDIYSVGYKQQIQNFSGTLLLGYAVTPVNPASQEMSLPALNNRFASIGAGYKITDAFSAGGNLLVSQQNKGELNNQTYKGSLDGMMHTFATLYVKTVF